jgi:hypothetical protein
VKRISTAKMKRLTHLFLHAPDEVNVGLAFPAPWSADGSYYPAGHGESLSGCLMELPYSYR